MKPDPLYTNLPAALHTSGRTAAQLLQQARNPGATSWQKEEQRRAEERIAMLSAEKKQKK